MNRLTGKLKAEALDLWGFLRRALFAVAIGVLVGAVGVAFHHAVHTVTHWRGEYPWLILLLPLGGIAIVLLYQVCGMSKDRGTNLVLVAVREAEPMKLRTAPLIFLSTVLTHLVGGSAGKEGAALQLGAAISNKLAHALGMGDQERRILTVCGMSAAFSALFGTPLTAALFSLEVVHVGVMQYAALVPALTSSLTAFLLAGAWGVAPTAFPLAAAPALSPLALFQTAAVGVLCAALAVVFCLATHGAGHLYGKRLPNPLLRAAVGGLLVLGLTLLFGGPQIQTYNGSGDTLVGLAVAGGAGLPPWTFAVKLLFTALTLGAGFRGGEIVPTLACGATFGCAVAPLLGLDPGFGAALGTVSTFCGVTNCPISSLLLAYELFGGKGMPLFALGIFVSYRLSGYGGLYSEQQIVYAKDEPIPYQ